MSTSCFWASRSAIIRQRCSDPPVMSAP